MSANFVSYVQDFYAHIAASGVEIEYGNLNIFLNNLKHADNATKVEQQFKQSFALWESQPHSVHWVHYMVIEPMLANAVLAWNADTNATTLADQIISAP